MTINYRRARGYLERFDFRGLFVEELGWAKATGHPVTLPVNGADFRLTPLAAMSSVRVFACESADTEGGLPDRNLRARIEREAVKLAHEHIIIFMDAERTTATWVWVKREAGGPDKLREHTYSRGQPGDLLLQKVAGVAFRIEDLDAEGQTSMSAVTSKVAEAFDVERITKRFYDQFTDEHAAFLKHVKGIDSADDRAWYTSVMLNRLMFIYFVQKKGFLNGDTNYLNQNLANSRKLGADRYYPEFLTTLFFEGFAREVDDRSPEARRLLGDIPYLNGGLFQRHAIEDKYSQAISISDGVFEQLFEFFDDYTWHLDDRPLHNDNEINPDVLGYIFEKYINQKQMGAYYTKEDITGYVCRNTVLPFLFDKLALMHASAVQPLPLTDIEPYIYAAAKQVDALPAESEPELAARHDRATRIRADFRAGKITAIDDFVTYNLDIERFTRDFLTNLESPLLLRAFYFDCLLKVTVLDPTVGSGAFLFAAMNILQPLYEICLAKMRQWAGPKYPDFKDELGRMAKHPSQPYFIYKSIIVNNLYGLDLMEEATEICKLRLFLKLVAQVDTALQIEPLPDIDFNIRAGNTLVGFSNQRSIESHSLFSNSLAKGIEEVDRELRSFRTMLTQYGVSGRELANAKASTQAKYDQVANEMDRALQKTYGADKISKFVATHHPFHWYLVFNQIMQNGGFDVIVGNPPYVNAAEVRKQYRILGYETESCPDIYANVVERVTELISKTGRCGMIVPLSITFSGDFSPLRKLLLRECVTAWYSSYDNIPAALFSGVSQRCTVWLASRSDMAQPKRVWVAPMYRWRSEYRPFLMNNVSYVDATQTANSNSLPKFASATLASVFAQIEKARSGGARTMRFVYPLRTGKHLTGFSQSARNFISVFRDEPPALDAETLKRVSASKIGYLQVQQEEAAFALLALLAGELFMWYWLTVGDGFDVTTGVVSNFAYVLNNLSDQQFTLLSELGKLLHGCRYRALVFKKNAGRYVGNYNYRSMAAITRRSDMVVLAGLGQSLNEANEIFSYVQRVLSINVSAGEKGIPATVKNKFKPVPIDAAAQRRIFQKVDSAIAQLYSISTIELREVLKEG
jgi:hypothetical protein